MANADLVPHYVNALSKVGEVEVHDGAKHTALLDENEAYKQKQHAKGAQVVLANSAVTISEKLLQMHGDGGTARSKRKQASDLHTPYESVKRVL